MFLEINSSEHNMALMRFHQLLNKSVQDQDPICYHAEDQQLVLLKDLVIQSIILKEMPRLQFLQVLA
jgi:hypothetical protein